MKVVKSDIERVAVRPDQYPDTDLPEIAFAGRSNVGKSSLLNLITGRKKLARVSGSPGKTRTINFYRINDDFRIADLPGYGYAKISKNQKEDWGQMIETYIEGRENLIKVVQLLDIRHKPTAQDVQMYDYIRYYGLDGLIVLTKADKVSGNERQKNISLIRKTLNLTKDDRIISISSLKKTGHNELLDVIEELIKEKENGSK